MFSKCKEKEELIEFSTYDLNNCSYLFNECSKLKMIYINDFKYDNAFNMNFS